jgi:DNA-directed RNA polymerase specialized sigma24 family protein
MTVSCLTVYLLWTKATPMFIKYACIGGSTYADLAKNEGQPLVTVKIRMRRALFKLRGGMEGAV